MALTTPESMTLIDGNYIVPQRAAAYLIVDGEEAAFFDNATRFSVPDLLGALESRGLSPESVRYIVVSHVHLDHSGGSAELAKHCPNATVLCHPRARRHLIDPTKLVGAARPIYGEDVFEGIFGEIESIDEGRVREVEDGDMVALGRRRFRFLHTPGHARHHISLHDEETNTVLSGDAFGLAQLRLQEGERPHLSYVVSPPDFSAEDARDSVRRILALKPDRVCVTHFGVVSELDAAAEQLFRVIDSSEAIIRDAAATDLEGEGLVGYCNERALGLFRDELKHSGLDPEVEEIHRWSVAELNVTRQGLAFAAAKMRDKANGQ